MLDIFNIQSQYQDSVKIYYPTDTATWQLWQKPRNCKFIWIMCIGTGGFGITNSSGGGGAIGGGAGAVTRALFPANVLPDTLYVRPGIAFGQTTYYQSIVSTTPAAPLASPNAMNIVCVCGAVRASSQNGQTGATLALAPLLSLGVFTTTAGANASFAVQNPIASSILMPGAAGQSSVGDTNSNIPSVTLGNIITPAINAPSVDGGLPGTNGTWSLKPLYFLGGSGGGYNSNTSGATGAGGNGAYGCGGGGGGGGGLAGLGGSGGKGGDGLVIIATF